jgi:putative transposase
VRTFEYRLYPTRAQRAALLRCLAATRVLYNEMLEREMSHHAETGRFLFKYDLSAAFKGRGGEDVPASVVQTLADRLDKALRRFLAYRAQGKRCGFPRFKTPNQWHSIRLRQYGRGDDAFLDEGSRHLRVAKRFGARLKIKLHRPLEGEPRTAHLVLRADGHWYALIVCRTPSPPGSATGDQTAGHDGRPLYELVGEPTAVGLDVGLRHFLADSEGRTVAPPQVLRRAQSALRHLQRRLCRRRKGSRRRKKAARAVARKHLKIMRQRRDFLFKTAKPYADSYDRIYVEALNIAGMARSTHLAKSIHDASWGTFLDILRDKAERAGHAVVEVSARATSQGCSRCGATVAKTLSARSHVCPHCGYVADRDVNAARNILAGGLAQARTVDTAGAQPSADNGGAGRRPLRSRRPVATELSPLAHQVGGG